MKKEDFFLKLKEATETDEVINENTVLKNLPEYSSLTTLSIIALIDENFEKNLTAKELNSTVSVKNLMELIGIEQFK